MTAPIENQMSEYRSFAYPEEIIAAKPTFSWKPILRNSEHRQEGIEFVAPDVLKTSTLVDINEALIKGVIFSTRVYGYDFDEMQDVPIEPRWLARVLTSHGFYVLAQYIETEEKFWISVASDEVYHYMDLEPRFPGQQVAMAPPMSIGVDKYNPGKLQARLRAIERNTVGSLALAPAFSEDKALLHESKFRVGQRLEIMDYLNGSQLHPARIQNICGRRMHVQIKARDSIPGKDTMKNKRQTGSDGEFWVDQESIFIFPVGFAFYNNLELIANDGYKKHAEKIADAIRNGTPPEYHVNDVTFEDLARVTPDTFDQVKVGHKFELLDPLNQQFLEFEIATVLRLCETPGYMIVCVDGSNAKLESFPIHINNTFMFPAGYARENGLKVRMPKVKGFKGNARWEHYLAHKKAEALPTVALRPEMEDGRREKLKVGMFLEAADQSDNQYIYPAMIRSIHGRVVKLGFLGWGKEADQLYDIDSHDLLPAGWCEMHGYQLRPLTTNQKYTLRELLNDGDVEDSDEDGDDSDDEEKEEDEMGE